MKKTIIKHIKQEDWYIQLIDEIKALLGEALKSLNKEVIRWKWFLGDLLYEHRDKGITDIMSVVAEDIKISVRELWRCYNFRKKFPNLLDQSQEPRMELFPEGPAMTWNKIVNKYKLLSNNPHPCQHQWEEALRCKKCKTIKLKRNLDVQEDRTSQK